LNFKKAFLLQSETPQWTKGEMRHAGNELYDVVYAGGEVVNLMAAYHLLLNTRNAIRILIIDPRSKLRDDVKKDFKVGESTLPPSSMMLFQDLGLHDWMVENCPAKHTLSWHWAKEFNKSSNAQQTDYYTIEEPSPSILPTYQVNRAKLEAYLVTLIEKNGGKYVRGFARVEEIGENGAYHTVKYSVVDESKVDNTEGENGYQPVEEAIQSSSSSEKKKYETVHARQLVDGSGRKFLIGTKLKLMLNKPAECYDIDNASAWVRVSNADYSKYIHGESGYLVGRPIWESSFYNTNHYMGPGYWIWVIPIETAGGREISIGVSFHKQLYSASQFNSTEKFLNFLKSNHENLWYICAGPTSKICDFQFLPKLAHRTKQCVSTTDNWYMAGEAAYNADPHYSTGLVFSSFQIIQNNTLILGKLAGVNNTIMHKYSDAYNEFQLNLIHTFMIQIHKHHKHLGNAGAMSWRISFETAGGCAAIATWLGRWFLCPEYCKFSTKSTNFSLWIQKCQHELLDDLVASGRNVGWLDSTFPNMINIMNLDFFKKASALRLWHFNGMIHNQCNEFQRTNVNQSVSDIFFYNAAMVFTFAKRLYGYSFFTNTKAMKNVIPLLAACLFASTATKILGFNYWRNQSARKIPQTSIRALHAHQFNKTYKPPTQANPWKS